MAAFPQQQDIGSPISLLLVKGGFSSTVGAILTSYNNLSAANSQPYISTYGGADIVLADDSRYYRNQAANAWILYFTSSNFSTGNASPLFTTSIVNPTTAPTLTFALSNAAGGTVLANNSGGSSTPVYTSDPALGIANTTQGSLTYYSSTSGSIITRLVGASANFFWNWPLSAGTAGQAFISGGGGSNPNSWVTLTSGTVTTFSAGNLSPLFTTSVANPTTAPALSFILSNAAPGTVLNNSAAITGTPAYTAYLILGETGTTAGQITLRSATGGSGESIIRVVGATGSFFFNLPLSAGTAGQALLSGGGGTNPHTYGTVLTGITADNGLTANTSTNVQLGGTLIQDTTINTSSFFLNIATATAGVTPLFVGATDSIAINASSTTGDVIKAQSGSGGTGVAFRGSSLGGGVAADLTTQDASTTTTLTVLNLKRGSSGTAADGIAGAIDYYVEAADGALWNTTRLISKFTTVSGSRTAQFSIQNILVNSMTELFVLSGNGSTRLNKYGVGTFAGTAAYLLGVDASGNLVETTPVGSGTANVYTPSLTNASNVTSSTAYECQYSATVDASTGYSVVTVSGKFQLTFTNSGSITRLGISLPIASAMSADQQVGGVAGSNSLTSGSFAIRADFANGRAEFYATAPGTGLIETYWFSFTYLVLVG